MTNDLQSIRNGTGLSQAQFAALMGVPVRTLQNWEQGRRPTPVSAIRHARLAAKYKTKQRGKK